MPSGPGGSSGLQSSVELVGVRKQYRLWSQRGLCGNVHHPARSLYLGPGGLRSLDRDREWGRPFEAKVLETIWAKLLRADDSQTSWSVGKLEAVSPYGGPLPWNMVVWDKMSSCPCCACNTRWRLCGSVPSAWISAGMCSGQGLSVASVVGDEERVFLVYTFCLLYSLGRFYMEWHRNREHAIGSWAISVVSLSSSLLTAEEGGWMPPTDWTSRWRPGPLVADYPNPQPPSVISYPCTPSQIPPLFLSLAFLWNWNICPI